MIGKKNGRVSGSKPKASEGEGVSVFDIQIIAPAKNG
jgi:hypothetical protein